MGDIFKGVAASGSIICYDEFNRHGVLLLPAASIAAATVAAAAAARSSSAGRLSRCCSRCCRRRRCFKLHLIFQNGCM